MLINFSKNVTILVYMSDFDKPYLRLNLLDYYLSNYGFESTFFCAYLVIVVLFLFDAVYPCTKMNLYTYI